MSHHRETVTAVGAPQAVGPYSHAVKSGGLIFLSGQTPIDPDTGTLVEGGIGEQTGAAWTTSRSSRPPPAPRSTTRCAAASTSPTWRTFKDVNEAYGGYFGDAPPARTHDRRRLAPARRRRRDRRDPCRSGLTTVTPPTIEAARPAVAKVARRTPVLSTRTISERDRRHGAAQGREPPADRLVQGARRVGQAGRAGGRGLRRGVVAASAGNHAQGAGRGRRRPRRAVRGVRARGRADREGRGDAWRRRDRHVGGASLDDCLAAAHERAREGGPAFVHPFDDPDVVAGQGSLGLELLEDVPDLAKLVVPVGGGGLAAGVAIAVKSARPEVEVVGVQVAACAPVPASLERGTPVSVESALTIADGIAVKRPGELTLALLGEWLDGMAVVDDEDAAEAMVLLLERCKLVVEGAGAVGVAALLGGQIAPARAGSTVAILSGGNVDPGLLLSIARRHETLAGRRLVVLTRVPDRPGALARLLGCVAELGANVVDVSHVREGFDLHVRETAVELVLETRGRDHAERVIEAMRAAGYPAQALE